MSEETLAHRVVYSDTTECQSERDGQDVHYEDRFSSDRRGGEEDEGDRDGDEECGEDGADDEQVHCCVELVLHCRRELYVWRGHVDSEAG